MNAIGKYAAVFGRPPSVVREPSSQGISACLFAPTKRSFWKTLTAEAPDMAVYITAGLSAHPMPVPAAQQHLWPARAELMAFAEVPIGGGISGTEDVPSILLQTIADYVLGERIAIGVGHTLDFQEPLASNIAMSAVLFTPTNGVDAKRIRRCTHAEELLNIVPITPAELRLKREQGIGALLDALEAAGTRPIFDIFRASAV